MFRALAGALALVCVVPVFAADKPDYQNVDPKIRDWFKGVHSPNGVPCCDIADGHYTTWRKSEVAGYDFDVPIEGQWVPVPKSTVVKNANNPTGDAIVWYVKQSPGDAGWYIRCFVLGNGA
jgi:hypothetical protein